MATCLMPRINTIMCLGVRRYGQTEICMLYYVF